MTATATPAKERQKKPQKKRGKLQTVLPIIVALIGLLLLLYPVVSTRVNNARQQEIAREYQGKVEHADNKELKERLDSADKYNKDLASGLILDPFVEDAVPSAPEYQAYLKELNLTDVMGTLTIPKIKVNLPIYHGTFDDILAKGVGHLYGTSLPVGGVDTHSVLTGHTGMQNATLFDNLPQLQKGDAFYLNVYGRKMKYVVKDIRVVLPYQTKDLHRVPGKDLVTLITCTPYGVNSHRLLVTGERTFMDDAEMNKVFSAKADSNPWTWWMILIVAFASLVALAFLAMLVTALRRRRKNKKAAAQAAANQALPRKSVHDKVEGTDSSDAAATDSV